jgi:hypothetical protein
MQDLRLVAADESATHLILRAMHGEEFRLAIDERLRAAVRGDRVRVGHADGQPETQLRPRDIQARIRAGESAEDVARAAGVPVERVRRFEGPVLAEREHMAQSAQRATVRRISQPDAPTALLGELVTARLEPLGVREDGIEWDSWRREDGRWTVQLSCLLDGQEFKARFTYDPRARTTASDDDEARWIAGEVAERVPRYDRFVPRLAGRPEVDDRAAPHVPPAPDAERQSQPRQAVAGALAAGVPGDRRRSRRVSPLDILVPSPAPRESLGREKPTVRPAQRMAPEQQTRDVPRHVPPDAPRRAPDAPRHVPPTAPAARAVRAEERLTGTDARPGPSGDQPTRPQRTRPKGRRVSVPSWDEILFGTRRPDD